MVQQYCTDVNTGRDVVRYAYLKVIIELETVFKKVDARQVKNLLLCIRTLTFIISEVSHNSPIKEQLINPSGHPTNH